MKKSLILSICFIIPSFGFGLPEDPIEYAQWQSGLLEAISKQRTAPHSEAIPTLARWVMQLSMGHNMEKGDRPVFHAAQQALIQIPGHAEYYRDRINEARTRFETVDKPDEEYITDRAVAQQQLLNEQMYDFQTLSQLPSVETVRVLGEFLSDERGRMEIPPGYKGGKMKLWDEWLQKPNSTDAAMALETLPLKSKPHAAITGWDKDAIRPWLLWYEQIKAGNRTFSFEGDPTEYNLTGPVREAKNPDTSRTTKRAPVEVSQPAQTSEAMKRGSNLPALVAIVLALLIGGGYWVYRRKSLA